MLKVDHFITIEEEVIAFGQPDGCIDLEVVRRELVDVVERLLYEFEFSICLVGFDLLQFRQGQVLWVYWSSSGLQDVVSRD